MTPPDRAVTAETGPTSVYRLLVRHDAWATDRLIGFCEALTPAQLDLSIPGTYGSIGSTLRHLVGAMERYHQTLSGQSPAPDAIEESAAAGLAQVRRRSRALGDGLLALADSDPERSVERRRRDGTVLTAKAGTILAQLIHHGNDHRTQIETTLSAHGITEGRPDLDVWSFVASGSSG